MRHDVTLSNGSKVQLTEGTECLHVDLLPEGCEGVNVATIYEHQTVIVHPPRYKDEYLDGFMRNLQYESVKDSPSEPPQQASYYQLRVLADGDTTETTFMVKSPKPLDRDTLLAVGLILDGGAVDTSTYEELKSTGASFVEIREARDGDDPATD